MDSERGAVVNAITVVQPLWMDEITKSYMGESWATDHLTAALISPTEDSNISVVGGLLRYKHILYVGSVGDLRRELMLKLHESAIGGHSGQIGTYHRLKSLFYWKGMKGDVVRLVQACDTC